MDFVYEVIYDDTPYVNVTYLYSQDIIDMAILISELDIGPQVLQVRENIDDNTVTISYEYFELTDKTAGLNQEDINIIIETIKTTLLLHGLHVKNNILHLGFCQNGDQVDVVVTSPEYLSVGCCAITA